MSDQEKVKGIHVFDNGLKVFRRHIIDVQWERYSKNNIHEAEEEELFLAELNKVRKGGVYVNIGAAIGYYSILTKLIRRDVQVQAYEPLALHRKYFHENIVLNGIGKNDIKIFKEAVSAEMGLIEFECLNFSSYVTSKVKSISLFNRFKGFVQNSLVRTTSLEDVLLRAGGAIDLLQMDIQGHELNLLEGSTRELKGNDIQCLIIGTHTKDIHEKCSDILLQAGYKLVINCFETKHQPDGILIGRI